ncbi:16S rRNA (cytosine(1402)-N(4))-methyltransferase RsmH [Planctomycetales bacterium ZRK34]|nr:16S rRNA (cytosine(1402)-N(4))-methyltransferase RsmH [Planctomycetales bacterium ZRK34]
MKPSPSSPIPPDSSPGHIPVLPGPVLELLSPAAGEVMLDCTLGRGGHAGLIMPKLAPGGRYIGLDVDPQNLAYVAESQPNPPVPMDLVHRNFADARGALDELEIDGVDLQLADLGFASSQMSDPARGLSFAADGPLDMRLNPDLGATAADLVNRLPERELADLIFRYGEERLSRKIARKIVDLRDRSPINTTRQLAEVCAAAYGPRGRRQRIDPATRTFQALRIAVNDELGVLEALLAALPRLMRPGGRVAIISFHSLEDRLVKHTFNDWALEGLADRLTKKPVTADDQERAANPRSRSAKCRAIRWLATLPRDEN